MWARYFSNKQLDYKEMINREELSYIKNILTLNNFNPNTDILYDTLTAIKENDSILFLKTLLGKTELNLNLDLLLNVYQTIKDIPELEKDLLDSFSSNQVLSKTALLNAVDRFDILTKESTVVIWGGWYGSILIPNLSPKVKKVISLDLDPLPLQIAKNRLFPSYSNIEYINDDCFAKYRNQYLETNLIINTSCEHMQPMKEWKWFGAGAMSGDIDTSIFRSPKLADECYFAFQSNNMFGIEGHINCVNSIDEFIDQLPERAEVLYQEEVEDTRGTRYMLVGKFNSL